MRKVEFEVPAEVFGDFAEKLTETGLENRVLGRNQDDEIEVEIRYEKGEGDLVDELEEYLEELIEDLDEDDEEKEDKD